MKKRDQVILASYADGETLQTIADKHGLTRERIRQIVSINDANDEIAAIHFDRKYQARRKKITDAAVTLKAEGKRVTIDRVYDMTHVSIWFISDVLKELNLLEKQPRSPCGTSARYRAGCRCKPCTKAHSFKCLVSSEVRREKRQGYPVRHRPQTVDKYKKMFEVDLWKSPEGYENHRPFATEGLNVACSSCGDNGKGRRGVEYPSGAMLCDRCLQMASLALFSSDIIGQKKV